MARNSVKIQGTVHNNNRKAVTHYSVQVAGFVVAGETEARKTVKFSNSAANAAKPVEKGWTVVTVAEIAEGEHIDLDAATEVAEVAETEVAAPAATVREVAEVATDVKAADAAGRDWTEIAALQDLIRAAAKPVTAPANRTSASGARAARLAARRAVWNF